MHTSMPDGGPLMPDKMPDSSALKPKREFIHQPCGPLYSHDLHVPAYAPSMHPMFKPYVQQTYLKKELGVQPLAHLQYVQQPPAYTAVAPKPGVAYVKPAMPGVNYQTSVHQSFQYVKPAMPPFYQKPLYYAPMYQQAMYHDAMPKILYGKYEAPVTQIVYQKPLVHAPVPYAAPKVVQVQEPHVSYVKPVVHAPPPVYVPPPVHNSAVVKPHCV